MTAKFGVCFRCGANGRVFTIQKQPYCEPCSELCINARPDYRKNDRRNPGNPPRGFGRRFEDPVR
jgi:hypothetical protein